MRERRPRLRQRPLPQHTKEVASRIRRPINNGHNGQVVDKGLAIRTIVEETYMDRTAGFEGLVEDL